MPWGTRVFAVYHGTVGPYADDIATRIQLSKCLPLSDFGCGFYTTRIFQQAVEFANERYRQLHRAHGLQPATYPDPECAAVLTFNVILEKLGVLDTLAFVQPTDDWLEFVKYCRIPGVFHKGNSKYYQAVYGPVLKVGLDEPEPGWEQLSFHDDHAVALLVLQRPILRGNTGKPEL